MSLELCRGHFVGALTLLVLMDATQGYAIKLDPPTIFPCWKEGTTFDPTASKTDHLTDARGHVRLDWAFACKILNTDDQTKRMFQSVYDHATRAWRPRPTAAYPTFVNRYGVWKPEAHPNFPLVPQSCDIPDDVIWAGVCEGYDRY